MQNKIFNKNLSKKTKIEIVVAAAVVIGLIAYIVWDVAAAGPLTRLFTDRERLIRIVQDLGPLGPLVYMLLQAVQGIVAPIPSNVVGIIGGFLFSWWGVLWTSIGATIGAAAVFWLSRRFGRPLIEKLVKKDALKKFDFVLNNKHASLIIFLIFLIPGLPDDIVCYVAGLTKIPLKKLIAIFLIGRLPAVVSNNYIGMGFSGEGNMAVVVIITIISVLIFIVLYSQQEKIIRLLDRQKKLEKQNKKLRYDVDDLSDDGKLNNSIDKKPKK